MRAMAIDYGSKRVGVASTDESGQFSLPRMVLDNDDTLVDKIVEFKNDANIDKVVIGESKNLDGTPNPIQSEIDQFVLRLKERGLEIVSYPEVFTTVEARRLQGDTAMTDASAAAILLKSWLESVYNK